MRMICFCKRSCSVEFSHCYLDITIVIYHHYVHVSIATEDVQGLFKV